MPADAIIFIPGIKGTKLQDVNRVHFDTIWSGMQSNFETIEDLELSKPIQGEFFDGSLKTIVAAGEIESLAYGEFLHDLKTDKPVFIFNYDWRMSAQTSGVHLANFMDYLVKKSAASEQFKGAFQRFDVITHSLGNFVLRNYMHRQDGMGRVNKVVFTVPPFKGAIDIASVALMGEGWFPNVKAKIRKLIRTFPGALELLPNYDSSSQFDNTNAHDFFNFNHWQANITDTTNSTIAQKFQGALEKAKQTVDNELMDLSQLSQQERERILVIARTGYDTYQSLNVIQNNGDEPRNFFDFEHACCTKDGDGRVPNISSCHYHNDVLTLMVQDSWRYSDYSHGFVLKDERVQKIVNRFLGDAPFNYRIPGSTVKKVVGLTQAVDASGLSFWQVNT